MSLDDFIVRAFVAGIGVAIVAGPLGCFIVWRRMAYFGDTMAHSALLGIALGFLLAVDLTLGVIVVTVTIAGLLILLQQHRPWLAPDTLLGILSHASLSIGLVAIGLMTWLRVDLLGYLFGDVLAVTAADIAVIYLGGFAALAALAGCVAVGLGLFASLRFDTPSGPSIVAAAALLFAASLLPFSRLHGLFEGAKKGDGAAR